MKSKSALGITLRSAFFASAALLVTPHFAHAHGAHQHEELATKPTQLSGSSLYQIESEWLNMKGEKLRLDALKGKPRLVAMAYTTCKTACPMIVQDMNHLAAKLPEGQRKNLGLTLFSFDPERDKPEALQKYATKMKLDPSTWTLLTPSKPGDATELAAALGVQFKKLKDGEFIHSNVVYLLNGEGEVVAKKEGLKSESPAFDEQLKKTVK